MVRRLVALSGFVLLASCGQNAPLRPAAGKQLPVKPMMASSTPTPEQLLTPPSYANPKRVDELIRRSQPRRVDPFDLPPPGGGAAPTSIGNIAEPTTNDTGVADPQ
jgi:hypothetical protein